METDKELLNAARAMDQDALVKIFDLYAPALYRYALRLGCDPVLADHIVGDVLANLVEQISRGKGPKTNLRLYLYQETHHMIIDRGPSSSRRALLEVATLLRDHLHSPSPGLEDRVRLDDLLKVIQNDLTEDQRHVIVLRFLEEFSLKETAVIIGKEVNHIKVIQNRALAKLQKSLGSSGTETTT